MSQAQPSPTRLSGSTSPLYSPDTTNVYASPELRRNQITFPSLPTPEDSTRKGSRTTASHASRRPPLPLPHLSLSLPDPADSDPDSSVTKASDSPLASPLTPPSPTTPVSPGPIVFASPSISSFAFPTPFPSIEPLPPKLTSGTPTRSQSLSYNSHARSAPVYLQADSYSTVESTRTSDTYRDETPFPTARARPRKPWREFARENSSSREASPSPLGPKDRGDIADLNTAPNGMTSSRGVLSTIQTTAPRSSSRPHTLSLSLTRPAHSRTFSSASLLTPNQTSSRSRLMSSPRSSPHLAARPSFPSRSPSPSPVHSTEVYKRRRSSSASLFRSLSERSRTRFSRSFHTGDVSVIAAEYAAAQCEAAFVSEAVNEPDAVADVIEAEGRSAGPANEEVEVMEIPYVEFEKAVKPNRSMFGKMRRLGGKVKSFVRVVRGTLSSVKEAQKDTIRVQVATASSPSRISLFSY